MFWKWSWSARILSVIGLGILAAILFPIFARVPDGGHRSSCQSNLKQIGLGLIQYTQDYDEKFPLIITGDSAYGWADAIQPYIKSTQLYQCPQDSDKGQMSKNPVDPLQNGYIDYPLNANLNGKPVRYSNSAWQIVSLDGNDGIEVTNARYCLTQIPSTWHQDESSPLYRHLKAGNYLFADGHVKSYTATRLFADKQIVF